MAWWLPSSSSVAGSLLSGFFYYLIFWVVDQVIHATWARTHGILRGKTGRASVRQIIDGLRMAELSTAQDRYLIWTIAVWILSGLCLIVGGVVFCGALVINYEGWAGPSFPWLGVIALTLLLEVGGFALWWTRTLSLKRHPEIVKALALEWVLPGARRRDRRRVAKLAANEPDPESVDE
jgi:Zn-dependent protease with chaperone function